jgi:uncharacterized protein (TIGR02145 family)
MKLKSIVSLVFCIGVIFNLNAQILPAAFGVATPSRPVGSNLGSSGPIITSGLVLHLDAGNTSSYPGSGTTWTDLSGNNNHGTLINGPTYSSTNSGSIVLDGSNDYIDFGNSASLRAIGGTTNITVSGWAYYTAYGGGGQSYSVITVKGAPWTWLLENYLDTFRFRIVAGGADVSVGDVSTHQLNVWYNVVGTYDGSNMRLYINGVLKNTVPQTGTLATNSETAKIGTWQGTDYNLTGRVSNVSIYNRVLTAAEVLENYNALRPRFGDVTNPTTGKIWMDRNLGATQVANSSTDAAAYGDLYQWGRGADGHQIRTSATTSTLSSTDVPGNANFILAGSPYDWRSTANNNLWQGVNGTNNPCPSGYRLPTETEWVAERLSWSSQNAAGAFASPLKLPVAGIRRFNDGGFDLVNTGGRYWSSTVSSPYSRYFYFDSNADMFTDARAYGASVRCIKN